ncbi:hypothetical protein ACFQZO_31180 [Bradyrhizobium sp. GCM10027634]|nr:hypothetical protein [Bradyrhizobium sp. WYCCWR 12677]
MPPTRLFRQYDAADPASRLVAGELGARWNRTLAHAAEVEGKIATHNAAMPAPIADPASLGVLASNLRTVWDAPTTDARLKKRIVRTLIHEVVADIDDAASEIVLVVHWVGGVHSEIRLPKREQARYEATRARRRYEAVDPDNRLVAGELERRWNERLLAVRALEEERGALLAKPESPLSEADRERLLALGSDLERAWNSPGATPATRKGIIRTLIHEIVVCVGDAAIELVIHWQGGDHTALETRKNRTGQHRWSTSADVIDLLRVLARQMPDGTIAAVLDRAASRRGTVTAGPAPAFVTCATSKLSHPTGKANAWREEKLLWMKPPLR